MSNNVNMSESLSCCPICMDNIDTLYNCLVTECGHYFHTSCLMKNVAQNGFDCPYCRRRMADKPPLYLEEDIDYSMTDLLQVEEQGQEQEQEQREDSIEEVISEEIEPIIIPSHKFITRKLINKDITMEQLVKCILLTHPDYNFGDRNEYGEEQEFVHCKEDIYNHISTTILNYTVEDAEQDYSCGCDGFCRVCY